MEMRTEDIIRKKILDAQEMVRDYEMYSKQTDDTNLASIFKDFAEECGYQAQKLQDVLKETGYK